METVFPHQNHKTMEMQNVLKVSLPQSEISWDKILCKLRDVVSLEFRRIMNFIISNTPLS